MEKVELGCSAGGNKEYGSITTLLRGEVKVKVEKEKCNNIGRYGGWYGGQH